MGACRRAALAAALAAVAAGAAGADAQPVRAPVGATLPAAEAAAVDSVVAALRADPATAPVRVPASGRTSWWAAAASAVVPGSGQALLGQSRGAVYAAVEAYMWLEYLEGRRFSNRQRAAYREIARSVARRGAPGSLPDGDWDYYERLEKLCTRVLPFNTRCASSGLFDRVPGGELDPEVDLNTYNGQIWAFARATYWPDPNVAPATGSAQYRNAVEFYRSRAEKPEFYWSWVDQQGSLAEYRTTIASANAAWREAIQDRSVIIANHVLSAVDAFVTVRVRRYGVPGGSRARRTGFEATIPWAPFGRPRELPPSGPS